MADKHLVRGVVSGLAGGLVAAWVMNLWTAGPGDALARKIETPADQQRISSLSDGEDATMKAADAIVSNVDGGMHLTHEQRAADGPIVHYAFAALMGGVYGGASEYLPAVRSGFGTTFGSLLFLGGDLIAVPAIGFSKPVREYPVSSYAGPFTAHLVYGATMELVRRMVRKVL